MALPNELDADTLRDFHEDVERFLADACGPALDVAGDGGASVVRRVDVSDALNSYRKVFHLDYVNAIRANALMAAKTDLESACAYSARLRRRTDLSARRLGVLQTYAWALETGAREQRERRRRSMRYGVGGLVAACLWLLVAGLGTAGPTAMGGLSVPIWAALGVLGASGALWLAAGVKAWRRSMDLTVALWADASDEAVEPPPVTATVLAPSLQALGGSRTHPG